MEKKKGFKTYAIWAGFILLVFQQLVYAVAAPLGRMTGITPYCPKIPAIDDLFKVTPIFILPYALSYVYWLLAPMVVLSRCERKHAQTYLMAYVLSCLAGGLVLIFAPTYMDRVAEGLLDGTVYPGFCGALMTVFYKLDGGLMAYNLLPSFHCLCSTISYLGVARRKEISFGYRAFSLVMTVTVYFSTLFVKQHYMLDVFAGSGIVVVVWILCKRFHWGDALDSFMLKLEQKEKRRA